MIKKSFLYFVLIILFFLVSCGPSSSEETNTPNIAPSNTGYEAPTSPDSKAYPVPTPVRSYPVPIPVDESKRFTIDEPLKAGSTEITGTGPANIVIKVVNISYVGENLGSGIVAEDGTFHISLSKPVEANHLIGLQLSDQELEPQFLDGPDYSNIPMVGLVLAQVIVEP